MSGQVATEWLFSVPDHVLEKHLASDPSTPTGELDAPEDHRVCMPRRVPLQVGSFARAGAVCLNCPVILLLCSSYVSWGVLFTLCFNVLVKIYWYRLMPSMSALSRSRRSFLGSMACPAL